ncbi:hypothetical protein EMCRGX_G026737 [Ephydatia muelleri]
MQSTMLRNSILRLPRCGLSLLADSAAVNKVPNRDDYLRHLLGHLKETPQQRSTNEMANTIQTVLWRRTQVDFYTDGWPQFTSIAARIRSPTVVDVVLHTSCKERLLELLRDDRILLYPGSHNNGGVIISDTEASLAEYLMKNMKSRDGKPLLTDIISGQMLQMSKDIAMSFHERTLICPEGYNIGVLRPKDAEFIHTFWNKSLLDSTKDSIKAFQFMIGSLPNSAIFHTSDAENPVAWVLTPGLSSKKSGSFVWPEASDPPAAAKKLDAKEDLKQLSDQLREMKEDAFSNAMRFTIQNALMGKIEVEVYCDEWPQFKAVLPGLLPQLNKRQYLIDNIKSIMAESINSLRKFPALMGMLLSPYVQNMLNLSVGIGDSMAPQESE